MRLTEIQQAYSENFARDTLCYLKCSACSRIFYYPRDGCPMCGSVDLQVLNSSGSGSVFSYTRIHRKGTADVIYAIIELEEGFRMYANMVDTEKVEIGAPVKAVFKEVKGARYPYFAVRS